MRLPATPTLSPFQTLRVTKLSSAVERFAPAKLPDNSHGPSPQKHQGQLRESQHILPPTTIQQLTPYPTKEQHGSYGHSKAERSEVIGSTEGVDSYHMEEQLPRFGADQGAHESVSVEESRSFDYDHSSDQERFESLLGLIIPDTDLPVEHAHCDGGLVKRAVEVGSPVGASAQDDEYFLDDDLADEDIASLLETAQKSVQEQHIPPSSVAQAWDHDSRSAVEYDSNLQYSSPQPWGKCDGNSTQSSAAAANQRGASTQEEDLLDENVDWHAVFTVISSLPKDPSLVAAREMGAQTAPRATYAANTMELPFPPENSKFRASCTRTSGLEKVHNRSAVREMSPNTVVRTCFRIGMMFNQTVRFGDQQDMLFELFARVTYSNRETLARKQHFQFVDLFKDQQPYPAGILSDWHINSQLDRHSSAFLDTSRGPRLCWCLCKPMRDPKAAIGWTYTVLSIEETNWEQIERSKKAYEDTQAQKDDVSASKL
ncbi:Uu.00g127400.m01.CDS01 [Anthostomella pinea]|uniref:Uu.00g127400.m01.CDS01 n=1 Tax=Anthostomella pinea TaxID=933095 RepID=A0AAI8VIQ2_9PEZI|nr:Uu.00g127400.m01.CDS01 [Anthostomella pinea]